MPARVDVCEAAHAGDPTIAVVQAQERQAVKQGKRPFYLKASEKRKLALVSKYNALKASGGLDKALAKRRQKVASKDHRLLPRGRRTEG